MEKLFELIYRLLSVVLVTTNIIEKAASMVREYRRKRRDGGNTQD